MRDEIRYLLKINILILVWILHNFCREGYFVYVCVCVHANCMVLSKVGSKYFSLPQARGNLHP